MMPYTEKDILKTLSKTMSEESTSMTEQKKIYENIEEKLIKDLPNLLDKGPHIASATVMLQIHDILNKYNLFTLLPSLGGKTLIAIFGDANKIQGAMKDVVSFDFDWLKYNRIIPTIIVNDGEKKENKIFAINYMNKVLKLSKREYMILLTQLEKNGIEAGRIIKAFVINAECKYNNENFIVIPKYVSASHDLFSSLRHGTLIQLVIPGHAQDLDVVKTKTFWGKTYILQSDNDKSERKWNENVAALNEERLEDFFKCYDLPCLNNAISEEITNALAKVEVFYQTRLINVNKKIEAINRDIVKLHDENVKNESQGYKKRLFEEKALLDESVANLKKFKNELMAVLLNYEQQFPNKTDFRKHYNAGEYIDVVSQNLFYYVLTHDYDSAHLCLEKLLKVKYKNADALNVYLQSVEGKTIEISDLLMIKNKIDSDCNLNKIKIELSNKLNLSQDYLLELISNIKQLETGKELYLLGTKCLKEKNINKAKSLFLESYSRGYEQAGAELINLYSSNPQTTYLETLARQLIPAANFMLGCQYLEKQKYILGIINLKLAAARGNMQAVEKIADIFYNQYAVELLNGRLDKQKVAVMIKLYEVLDQKSPEEKFKLRIGLLLYRIEDYEHAYDLLKNIDDCEAQYLCGKMCQYGRGMSKNIKTAQTFYEKINKNAYKDKNKELEKIKEELLKREKDASKTKYKPERRVVEHHSSGGCFITTAACQALKADDNCEELNKLRWFRDVHILGDGQDGNKLVEEYYKIGPLIVNRIEEESDPKAIYSILWKRYIRPSYKYIENCEWDVAKQIYIEMVKMLCEKYSISVDKQIMKKYAINVKN